MKRALIAALRAYKQWLSPLLPPSCRYTPSCSEYAMQAIALHGSLRGCWMALSRLLRCNPWGGGGFDPVPRPKGETTHMHWSGDCGQRAEDRPLTAASAAANHHTSGARVGASTRV